MHYASPYRVEAVLSHADEQGVEKLVVYTLWTLSAAEHNYS